MAIKSLVKTRWQLEPDRVAIYPYGLNFILSVILAVIFAVITYLLVTYENFNGSNVMILIAVEMFIVLLFWCHAFTHIEFDNRSGVMRKKVFGFLPVTSIAFAKLHAISPITNFGGSYHYRIFRKDHKFGKGIQLTAGYTKNDDPNAIAFVNEVGNTVHAYLDAHDSPADLTSVKLDGYRYFEQEDGQYVVKKSKIGLLVTGVVLFAVGIHELTPFSWIEQQLALGWILMISFLIIGGAASIAGAFTKVAIDPIARTLERKGPIAMFNKVFSFEDFNGLQTVRKSTNFIYSGTDVQLYFLHPTSRKEEVIVIGSFYKSKNVERFVQEFNQIIATN